MRRVNDWIRARTGVVMSADAVASVLQGFVDGTGEPWEWDDFTSVRIREPRLDAIRMRCATLPVTYPPTQEGHYCSDEGMRVLTEIIRSLRERSPRT
jgi:hypothetical protein